MKQRPLSELIAAGREARGTIEQQKRRALLKKAKDASTAADEIIALAEEEADSIRAEARSAGASEVEGEKTKILDDAKVQAAELITRGAADAEEEADRILKEAKSTAADEAKRVVAEAKVEAEELKASAATEAKDAAAKILADAKAEAAAIKAKAAKPAPKKAEG